MKQFPCVILTACTLFISILSHAQIKQGEKLLGANLSLLSSKSETDDADNKVTVSNFSFTPQLGFGLQNNWIVGLQAGYTSEKETQEDDPEDAEYKYSAITIGAFARKFKPFNEHVGMFGQLNVDLSFGKEKDNTSFDGEDKINGMSAYIRPGLYFFASKKIIIEATFGQLGYTSEKYTNDEYDDYEHKYNEVALSFADGLSFGIKFVL